MNYGEELAYWYLRFNGFFPIANFVMHKSGRMKSSSDCDVLAVRPPHVYEKAGGEAEDWDQRLADSLDLNKTLGVVCEVKTGAYRLDKLFKKSNLKPQVERIGFAQRDDIDEIVDALSDSRILNINNSHQIFKLLIANEEPRTREKFVFIPLADTRKFLAERMKRYMLEKNRDRMFFSSNLLQDLIDQNGRSRVALNPLLRNDV